MDSNNSQSEYELREARSEISRHHKLIVELRDSLDWALNMIDWADTPDEIFQLVGDDRDKYERSRRLLNRQVS